MLSSHLVAGLRGRGFLFFFNLFEGHCLFYFSENILELSRTDRSYAL